MLAEAKPFLSGRVRVCMRVYMIRKSQKNTTGAQNEKFPLSLSVCVCVHTFSAQSVCVHTHPILK